MVYLQDEFHMKQVFATNVVNIWSGTTNFAPLFGAFLSDTYLGRFRTLAYASIASLLVRSKLCNLPNTSFLHACIIVSLTNVVPTACLPWMGSPSNVSPSPDFSCYHHHKPLVVSFVNRSIMELFTFVKYKLERFKTTNGNRYLW